MPAISNYSTIWRSSLRAAFVSLVTISCCGCFQSLGSPPPELLQTNLPPAPSFAKPAVVQEPKLGTDEPLEVVTRRERAGRLYDDRVIRCFTLWYETLRSVHAQTAPDSEVARIEAECMKKPAAPAAKKKAAPKAATS